MASARLAMLVSALALTLPVPAEATMRVAVCGQAGTIDIPLHRDGDGKSPEICFAACHALGCERSRRSRDRT